MYKVGDSFQTLKLFEFVIVYFLLFVMKMLSINQKLSLILVITDSVRISFTLRRQITTIACPWLWCIVIGHGNQMPFFVLLVPTQSFNIERKLGKMGRYHFWRCIYYLLFHLQVFSWDLLLNIHALDM